MPLSIIWSMAVIAVQLFPLSITTVGKSWWGEMLPRGGLSVPWNPEINELYFSQHLDLSLRKKKKEKAWDTAKCVRQMWLENLPEVPAGFVLAFLERLKTRMAALNLIYVISCLLALLTGHLLSTLLCPPNAFFFPSLHFFSSFLIWTFHEMKQKY